MCGGLVVNVPLHLGLGSYDDWPGGASCPLSGFGFDHLHDVAWLRLSQRDADALAAVHLTPLPGPGALVMQLDISSRLLALGVTQASATLPPRWLLNPADLAINHDERSDLLEVVWVDPDPGVAVGFLTVEVPGAGWELTAFVEPSGQLAAVQLIPVSVVLSTSDYDEMLAGGNGDIDK
jgi:hypothetical protein